MQILCTTIVGRAFLPSFAGAMSDAHGYVASFVAPMLCCLLLCGFAAAASRAFVNRLEDAPAAAIVH